ncbi:hypothetical protein [Chromobacterium amazonense]|uniref:hypothetical protein n=1 Tax=Chromobacterium amazonense TaxID=1382803 RepID=UPI0031F63157
MSKSVDFPVKEAMPVAFVSAILGVMLNAATAYHLFYESAPGIYNVLMASIFVTPIFAVAMVVTYYKSNFEDTLPCYIFGFFLALFPFLVFFIGIGLISSLISPPVPTGAAVVIFVFLMLYIVFSARRSSRNILLAVEKIDFLDKAYVFEGNRPLLKYKAMKLLDETVDKNIFHIEKKEGGRFSVIKVMMFVMAAMLGGLYKIFPDPSLVVRMVLAFACFLITPAMIFHVAYVYYVQYSFPKKIFGKVWYKACRETS